MLRLSLFFCAGMLTVAHWDWSNGVATAGAEPTDIASRPQLYAQLIVPQDVPKARPPQATAPQSTVDNKQPEDDDPLNAPAWTLGKQTGGRPPANSDPLGPAEPIPLSELPEATQIRELIDTWARTVSEGNANDHCSLYADQVERYFKRRNVTNEQIRQDKQQAFKTFSKIIIRVTNLEIQRITASDAVITFDKSWDTRGERKFSGSVKQRMKLSKLGADWKITSEEELEIYWVDRSK